MSSGANTIEILEEQNVAMLKMLHRAKTIINQGRSVTNNMNWILDFEYLKDKIGDTYEPKEETNDEKTIT